VRCITFAYVSSPGIRWFNRNELFCTHEAQSAHGDHHAGAVRAAGRRTHHYPLPKDRGEEEALGQLWRKSIGIPQGIGKAPGQQSRPQGDSNPALPP
jgi:hypothetical protein